MASHYNSSEFLEFSTIHFNDNVVFDDFTNSSSDDGTRYPLLTPFDVIKGLFLSILILSIVIGNTFVILSVLLFREMRTLMNGLIVSLASADLLVALIVLPISLYDEIAGGEWRLGRVVCDFWITADVFCCTASILNIAVIALDRYWLIARNVRYTHSTRFSRKRVCTVMVIFAWSASALISSAPLFGWRSGRETAEPTTCLISQDITYTVFSTFGAFWFPLSVICSVYYRIFKIARRRQRTRARAKIAQSSLNSTAFSEMNGGGTTCRFTGPALQTSNGAAERTSFCVPPPPPSPSSPPQIQHDPRNGNNGTLAALSSGRGDSVRDSFIEKCRKRRTVFIRRRRSNRPRRGMRSSARTLGLIIGGFLVCWLPFFIIATVRPFCNSCEVPPAIGSLTLWLGYFNSLLNPAIYAIWDKNFKRSFHRLSHCEVRWSNVW